MAKIPYVSMDQLDRIAQACRSVLSADPSPAIVANPYLHVLSAHPNGMSRYEGLLLDRSPLRQQFYNFMARQALRALALTGPGSPFAGDPLPARADVLFISHFLRASQAGDSEDLYFGSLPERLSEDGIQTAIGLINHSPDRRSGSRNWNTGAIPRILLNPTMGLTAELRIGRQLAVAATALRNQRRHQTEPFIRAFLDHAGANAAGPGSFTAMRIAEQVKSLVGQLQPKAIVITFEGHSWERLAFHAARAVKPDIVCIGHHHSVLFPFADAMRQTLGRGYDPDHILTAGRVSYDWLRAQPALKATGIGILGSARAPSRIAETPQSGSTCLVIPEGLMSESMALCRLAVEAAQIRPNLTFRLRLHPLLKRERLISAASDLTDLPPNVVWSDLPLAEDLSRCRWALYRGSSAVITATLSGLKPIYFSASCAEVSIDPLAALTVWRENVCSAQETARAMDADMAASDADRQSGYDQASTYCRTYFMPIDTGVLKALLPDRAARTLEDSAR